MILILGIRRKYMYSKLFKNKHFRRFFYSLAILNLGLKLSNIALACFVYKVTGSSLAVGTVLSVATIAPLISSIFIGGILDQYNRRTVMIMENALRGFFLSFIPILYWLDVLTVPFIIIIVFINGILSSFTTIGTSSILPSFVDKEELEAGNAVVTMTGQIGSLFGPALGGLCTAMVGAPITLFINVVCFFLASFLYFSIPNEVYHRDMKKIELSFSVKEKLQKFMSHTKDGFRYVLTYPVLIMIACVTFLFNLTYAPLDSMLPVYINKVVKAGPEILGFMWSCFACGSLLGSFCWGKFKKNYSYSYVLGLVITLWGVVPVILSFFSSVYILYISMFLGGIVYAPYNIVAPTLRQRLVSNEFRGRVFGVYGLIGGLGYPIGIYLGGLFGEYIGASYTILLSGVATMTVGILVCLHPVLRFKTNEVQVLCNKESHSI
ncbi:hypothetical protein COE51_08590 [Bacillus pseudomycoides]|nr:hypothetical protein COE51_08590 [Bacillus pseudomycoides]